MAFTFNICLFFCSILTCLSEFEPCRTKLGMICKCSPDAVTIICIHKGLKKFPFFDHQTSGNVQNLHLDRNEISSWPKSDYWNNFARLRLVSVRENILRGTSNLIPQSVEILSDPCPNISE